MQRGKRFYRCPGCAVKVLLDCGLSGPIFCALCVRAREWGLSWRVVFDRAGFGEIPPNLLARYPEART